jgi:hypothetical protein
MMKKEKNKPMKHHLLLCLTILPLWTASAAILPLPSECRGYAHPCGTIVRGFFTESASGKIP